MTFDYLQVTTSMDSITIDDIGNTTIVTYQDSGKYFIFKSKTSLWWTEITKAGPFESDTNLIDKNYFLYNKIRFEFNEKKLFKYIKDFINQEGITQAIEVNEEFLNKINLNLQI